MTPTHSIEGRLTRHGYSIAHVVISDKPWGAVRVVLELAKQQSERHSVWIAMNRDLLQSTSLPSGVRGVALPLDLGPRWPGTLKQVLGARGFAGAARVLKDTWKTHPWDVVHFHLPNAFTLAVMTDSRMNKVFTVHGRLFENWLLRRFERRLAGMAIGDSRVSTISQAAFAYLPKNSNPRWIPNGVDAKAVAELANAPVPPEINTEPDHQRSGPLLVFPHNFVSRKGQDLLIKSMQRILASHPGTRALLIGGGPDEGRLKAMAVEARLGNSVKFIRFTQNVYPYMLAADVILSHLSLRWPFPSIVELEALALGRAVVTMFTEEKMSLYGDAVCYIRSEDPESLASAIDIAIKPDAVRMAAARRAVERLSWGNLATKYSQMYEESRGLNA